MKKIMGLWILLTVFGSSSLVMAQSKTSPISDEKAHEIVMDGTPDDVRKLLNSGYDVNKIYLCNTLLNTAVKSTTLGQNALQHPLQALEKIKILINSGADVNLIPCPKNSMSALHWAVSLPRSTEFLEQEIYSRLEDLPQVEGECNFPTVVSKPCKDITAEDIEKIKVTMQNGFTAKIKYLAPYFIEIIKYLVDSGAQINANEEIGMKVSPLHLAAQNPENITLEPLQYLIKKNADINATDAMGNTALFYAFGNGNTKTVELLIKAGADTNIRNIDGGLYNEVTAEIQRVTLSDDILTE